MAERVVTDACCSFRVDGNEELVNELTGGFRDLVAQGELEKTGTIGERRDDDHHETECSFSHMENSPHWYRRIPEGGRTIARFRPVEWAR
jgi:hypothetical protein